MNRLKENLIEASKFGRDPERRIESKDQLDPEKGVSRLEGTEANKKLRDFAVDQMKAAGLKVSVDKIGNIFGRKAGAITDQGAVMCGSHLDSVVNGGHLDGVLGVFAAIEALQRFSDEGFKNGRPIEVVAFTGEEGSAFGITLLGSSALTGKIPMVKALATKNTSGKTLAAALETIGYQGDIERRMDDVDYFIELHIEQGPVLYAERISIGIVENITGIAWVTATIRGIENHAGTAPMKMRKDALVAAADVIAFVQQRASEMADQLDSATVGTVGELHVYPNGINTVPGKVQIGIDLRDVSSKNLEQLKDEIVSFVKGLEAKHGVDVKIQIPPIHTPVPLSKEVVKVIEQSIQDCGIRAKNMSSGAVHDALNMATRVKTGMIFVPSVNGISHSPLEWTDWEDIEKGVVVLTQTLKSLSK